METVISPDGTRIAYARSGDGPPLVLVHGAIADHTRWAAVLPELERNFTVIAMDRRGRGGSGDSESYAIEREYEDVAAVVEAAGPDASLLGHSYGALCALEAALSLRSLRRLILYEPLFALDDTPPHPPELLERLAGILEEEGRDAFLTYFFRELAGVPEEHIAAMRADPSWKGRVQAAPTALREVAASNYAFDPDRFRGLNVPTALLLGSESPAEFEATARAIDSALPDSRVIALEGQGHVAMSSAPQLFARKVTGFLDR